MGSDRNVIYHTEQAEISHSRAKFYFAINLGMDESEAFRANLLAVLKDRGLNETEVSLKAGLNRRAVTDIRERRAKSPKLSTVFSLAKALNLDPGEMLGLGPRARIDSDLAEYLGQYSPEEQAQLLRALRALQLSPDARR